MLSQAKLKDTITMLRHSVNFARRSALRVRIPQTQQKVRCFGSRRDKWIDTEIDPPDDLPVRDKKDLSAMVSPDFMELYQYNPQAYLDQLGGDDQEDKDVRRKKVLDDLALRTGRGWTDPWAITEENWSSKLQYDDLPDWTPDSASKLSRERLKILEGGVPTLDELAKLPLPPPPPPHPSVSSEKAKEYAAHRRQLQYKYILGRVATLAKGRVAGIEKLETWEEKQDAVDELFESIEFTLKEKEVILGRHPSFPMWVEKAIEEYLESVQRPDLEDDVIEKTEEEMDEEALPIFMDLFDPDDMEGDSAPTVPKILHPLQPHPKDGDGRMVEEWEIAAHDQAKRIMLRQSTRQVAKILCQNATSRVYVNGDKGVGKTAALLSIVAAARKSGHIVLFVPDGDRLRKHGHYIEPSSSHDGLFDLPVLSQELCLNLLESHGRDLQGMNASIEVKEKYSSADLIRRMPEALKDELSLEGLLQYGKDEVVLAPMCYSIVVETLMGQSDKSFLAVLDEFNCYYDYGHYFHMDYDKDAKKSIPLDRITLFKPFLDAMGLDSDPEMTNKNPPTIKRGGIVVGISENRAVARRFTDGLTASALEASKDTESEFPLHVVTVPRYSHLEVDHILSNFDTIGVGRLRFDRGDTVIDEQETSYVRMLSGSNGQLLLDACMG
ncbi:Mitochondrial ribosomal death-associated protein 3 [Fragilaria crotonensis]|nr:Mitochondrial ribosomal death-associated protein 3 [Fragilaria crotonensis]